MNRANIIPIGLLVLSVAFSVWYSISVYSPLTEAALKAEAR